MKSTFRFTMDCGGQLVVDVPDGVVGDSRREFASGKLAEVGFSMESVVKVEWRAARGFTDVSVYWIDGLKLEA